MPDDFPRTQRSLGRTQPALIWLTPAIGLALAWCAWLTCSRVDVYASTTHARVEVERLPVHIAAEDSGRVVAMHAQLGARIDRGHVLTELDATLESAALERSRRELERLEIQATAYRKQIEAEERRRKARWELSDLDHKRARIELERTQLTKQHQDELARVADQLHARQAGSRLQALAAQAERSIKVRELAQAVLALERARADQQYSDAAEQASIAQLERERTEIESERRVEAAVFETARENLARRTIRAPSSGKLGQVTALQVGDVLHAGELLATLVPNARVRVVADFAAEAVGRVRIGQPARVRVDNFSFLEFGMLDAQVTQVANEAPDLKLRVELAIDPRSKHRIPLQHGLSGSVDVRVDRASPWSLWLRGLGGVLFGKGQVEE
jgi:multidrug resistance efflux pump